MNSVATTTPVLRPERWVDEHGDYLYQFAMARVRNPEAAEELVQQAFVSALGSRHTFVGRSTERTWLTAILKRKVADWLRETVRDRLRETPPEDDIANSFFTRLGHWKKKPDEWSMQDPGLELNKVEFREILAGCLDKLPSRLRHVFVMKYVDEESAEEIRRSVEVTATNLAVMLHRTRLRLWRCLKVHWFGEDPGALSEGPT